MDKKELSACLKIIKLITSSLFARKQPFMIIDGTKPATFYYTNIERERVALYKPTPDDVLSRVTIKSADVMSALYNSFPILAKSIVQLDLMKFSTHLNKSLKVVPDKFPELNVDFQTRLVTMAVPASDGTGDCGLLKVGVVLSAMDVEFYENILKKHMSFSDKLEYRKFKAISSVDDDKVSLEIVELAGIDPTKNLGFALPIKDGFNAVSSKEYIAKRGSDPFYNVDILVDPLLKAAKTAIDFSDDWLDAVTIMPGALWFLN